MTIYITAKEARELASLPAELQSLDALIRRAAERGDAGTWLPASEYAKDVLRKKGFELTTDQQNYPDKVHIWWGN